jgi:hypothetical protein
MRLEKVSKDDPFDDVRGRSDFWRKNSNTYPVKADQCGEIWCLEQVDHLDKFCTVDGIIGRKNASWKEEQLQEGGDCLILGQLGRSGEKPRVLFGPQPGHHPFNMLSLLLLLVHQLLHEAVQPLLLLLLTGRVQFLKCQNKYNFFRQIEYVTICSRVVICKQLNFTKFF